MKTSALFLCIILQTLAIAFSPPTPANADTSAGLPAKGMTGQSALLLDLGSAPPTADFDAGTTRVITGEVSGHPLDVSIRTDKDEVSTLHPGLGDWQVSFRFNMTKGLTEKPYLFWARWRQGGDPNVSVQSFEIWAGSEPFKLERRAVLSMKPKGWDYAWIAAESPVNFKKGDSIIEVRNSGAGHDAKVFDAFLLASPYSSLPARGETDRPLVLLDLGKAPVFAALKKMPAMQVYTGTATAGNGAASLLTETDEVQVFHPGFGEWGANFHFQLDPALPPGQYGFYARYKSGGEVSQVSQQFTVKIGAKSDELATRGRFILTNDTPWAYQWRQAPSKVTILPGDRWLRIDNSGQADGAKVFDAFLLKLETPLGNWLSADQARSRHRFLALIQSLPESRQQLYVLDGKGAKDDTLFRALAADAARPSYERLAVSYLIGPEAEALAGRLNIASLPALLMTDDKYSITGALTQPRSEHDVIKFLSDPSGSGRLLMPAKAGAHVRPKPLRKGAPAAWLVGGIQAGRAGISLFGLDGETVLRPNPGQSYLRLQLGGGEMRTWQTAPSQLNGITDIEAKLEHAYAWSYGTGYAHLYLHVDQSAQALLHLKHSGVKADGWLDGQALKLVDDPKPPAGLSTEAMAINGLDRPAESPKIATLSLSPGWHRLLIKLVMRHDQGQRFYFSGIFTDQKGRPLDSIKTQPFDPEVDPALNKIAAQLRPLVFLDAPANLLHPGESAKLRVDMRWHPILEETALTEPLPGFQARLRLRLVDYNGNKVAEREMAGAFPGLAEFDFGKMAEPGYYAIYPSLYTLAGRLIMNYPADGFSVVRGAAEQKKRLDKKKLWNNNYYALADGDNSFRQEEGYFSWLERMGIYQSYGAYPGFDQLYQAKWQRAKQRGLVFFADSSGDSAWLNDDPADGRAFIVKVAEFTRFVKSTNEIDIRSGAEWQKLRDPAHWVQRARLEYEQLHKQRSDAHYVGGSLVRPGDAGEAGQWFRQVLQQGLDRYHDAWDVHAYPQQAPRFGGPIGNSESEDERGVLAAYAGLGRTNPLPFWLGETGAKAMHGETGRRWQAEQAAKMIAWVNSRSDYLGLAFCIAHEYDRAYGRLWDYSMGHKPGEAALYTAGALIDGLPYRAVDTGDRYIQAAYFGPTFMIWRSDDSVGSWRVPLAAGLAWVLVDVVGQVRKLMPDGSGSVDIPISASPVYVLARSDYERLTRY